MDRCQWSKPCTPRFSSATLPTLTGPCTGENELLGSVRQRGDGVGDMMTPDDSWRAAGAPSSVAPVSTLFLPFQS